MFASVAPQKKKKKKDHHKKETQNTQKLCISALLDPVVFYFKKGCFVSVSGIKYVTDIVTKTICENYRRKCYLFMFHTVK